MLNVKVKKNSDDYEDVFNNVIDYIDLDFDFDTIFTN